MPEERIDIERVTLEVSKLCGRYGARTVFSGVEFSLKTGDCLVVAGPNGAGKSTLLRILSGLARPHRGHVHLHVNDSAPIFFGPQDGRPDELGRYVGLASPQIEFYGELTAAENLLFYARVRGIGLDKDGVLPLLESVGLSDRGNDRVSAFSSGMKQRLRLLFALQHRPPVLLLDEPGSNLDEKGKELVARIVEDQLRSGLLILATNDPQEVLFGNQVLKLG